MVRRYALALGALLAACLPATASGWEIQRLEARISVRPDGRLRVVETLQVNFGAERHHGILRLLPLAVTDPAGRREPIDIRLRAITGAEGQPWPARVRRRARRLEILIGRQGAFLTGEQRFVLTYDVDGALRSGPDLDELYWDVTGQLWEVPIIEAEAVVELPQGVEVEGVDAASNAGKFGARGREADLKTIDATRVRFVLGRGLTPHEALTIAVVWPAGHVHPPGLAGRAGRVLGRSRALAPVAVLLVLLFAIRHRRRRRT